MIASYLNQWPAPPQCRGADAVPHFHLPSAGNGAANFGSE